VFFSYASFDDRDRRLSHLRERLEGELRAVSGRRLKIFQDRLEVNWGQAWKSALDNYLDSASVLVAVITPTFLTSAECRREIRAFRAREERLGREDLILPLYYIECEELENLEAEVDDDVVTLLRARQRLDGRFIPGLPMETGSRRMWLFINSAARQLHKAIGRAAYADETNAAPQPLLISGTDTHTTSIPDEDFGLYWLNENEGRDRERDALVGSIDSRDSHLIVVHGAAGIGKTTLALSVVKRLLDNKDCDFDFVACRSLRKPPALEDLLLDLISFLSSQQESLATVEMRVLIDKLRQLLSSRRCLLVLDNLESLFEPGQISGVYRREFEVYRLFLQTLSTLQHDGCVLLTSRDMPRELQGLVGLGRVQSFALVGLDDHYGESILKRDGVSLWSPRSLREVIRFYGGNPFALSVVAAHVKETCAGSLDRFLDEDGTPPLEYLELLTFEVNRLNELEFDILNWIALENGPVSAQQLREDLVHQGWGISLHDALSSLAAHHLIQCTTAGYEQTPVLSEFVTTRLIRSIAQELVDSDDVEKKYLRRYALVRAQAKSDVQAAQRQLVLGRLAEELDRAAGGPPLAKQALQSSLEALKKHGLARQAYGPGNILNLVLYGEPQFQWSLREFDFFGLAIRQVDFGNQPLRHVDFSQSQFWRCRFIAAFRLVASLAFSPGGEMWASGDADGDVRIWRTYDGRELFHVRHGKFVRALAFSPNGSLLATVGFDCVAKIWSIDAPDASISLRHTLASHRDWVGGVAFSPDGKRLATASDDGTVRLWGVDSGEQQGVLRGHRGQVSGVAFFPDPSRPLLASCGKDRTIRIWDAEAGAPLRNPETDTPLVLEGHQDWVWSIAFSPDGGHLASSSDDKTVRLWSTSDWRCVNTLQGHQHWVWSVAFSPDGQTVASGGLDATIRLWTVGGRCRGTLRHRNPVWALAFRPLSNWLASAAEDQTVRFWDVESGECIRTLQGHSSRNRAVAFNAISGELASVGDDRLVRIWYPPDSTSHPIRTIHGHTHWIRSVAYSPDGQTLATASDDHTIGIWDVWSIEQRLERLKGHAARVNAVAFSPDGEQLASGSDDRTIRLWNLNSRQSTRVLKAHKLRVKSLAFDESGQILVSGSHDGTVLLWDLSSARVRERFRAGSRVESVSISPDGRTVACGCEDHTIRIWDAAAKESGAHRIQRHRDSVRSLVFSADGAILAAGGDDGLISLWDVATREFIGKLSAEGTPRVSAVAFRTDGAFLASAHQDHTIRVWNVEKRDLWAKLNCPRPYEGLILRGAFGLSEAERRTLHLLGAVE
jgi:WD40 repeat protein